MSPATMYSLALLHHRLVFGGRRVGRRFGRGDLARGDRRRVRQRLVERGDDALQALARRLVGFFRRHFGIRAHRRDDGDLILDDVEDRHHRWAHEDAVGNVQGVGRRVRQPLHQAHGIVAHVAEDAGRHRRQLGGQRDLRVGEQGAQRGERRLCLAREGVGLGHRRAIDEGLIAVGAPYQVRLEADDGIAPARRAAFDRFQ